LTQTCRDAFASARELDYLLRDEQRDGVASIYELKGAQRVLEHVAKHGDFFRIECVAVQQLPDGHGRNSCALYGREPVGLPHHRHSADDVNDINISLLSAQQENERWRGNDVRGLATRPIWLTPLDIRFADYPDILLGFLAQMGCEVGRAPPPNRAWHASA
jgi:hypothetical protein